MRAPLVDVVKSEPVEIGVMGLILVARQAFESLLGSAKDAHRRSLADCRAHGSSKRGRPHFRHARADARPLRRGDVRSRARALCRRPQAGRPRAAAPAKARRDAQPDHHRRAQVRDDEHPPLPRPSPRDSDVEAEGAQLLRRGAELGSRPGLVPRPLRPALRGARRVLAPLHEPPPLRGGRRADPARTFPTPG